MPSVWPIHLVVLLQGGVEADAGAGSQGRVRAHHTLAPNDSSAPAAKRRAVLPPSQYLRGLQAAIDVLQKTQRRTAQQEGELATLQRLYRDAERANLRSPQNPPYKTKPFRRGASTFWVRVMVRVALCEVLPRHPGCVRVLQICSGFFVSDSLIVTAEHGLRQAPIETTEIDTRSLAEGRLVVLIGTQGRSAEVRWAGGAAKSLPSPSPAVKPTLIAPESAPSA